jgi:hypothetical protein
MTTTARWVIVAVAALAVLALLIWARGNVHHHGNEVGSSAVIGH